jgi:sodium/potassium-transporting ATPase subunit alpha
VADREPRLDRNRIDGCGIDPDVLAWMNCSRFTNRAGREMFAGSTLRKTHALNGNGKRGAVHQASMEFRSQRSQVNIHRLSIDDALTCVGSGAHGLSSAEAARRLKLYGPNRMEHVTRQPLALRLLKEFFQFFSVILWCAAALAFVAEWYDPGEGMARIGYAIVVVILISGGFSFWQEYRAERTLAALQKLLPRLIDVFRDGSVLRLPTDQLVVGDIVALRQGDQIPADCRLIEGFGVRVNCATLTGESAPRSLDTNPSDPSEGADLIHCRNILLAGTSLVSGQAKGVVFATGKLTEFGHIAHIAQTGAEIASPLRKQLAYLSRLIAVLSIAVGALFFAIGALIGVPVWQDVLFFIGIIVAMVPEGLLPTLTLALVLAAQRMAKRNVLIRHLTSVEALGSATVICTDKTGTLTENRPPIPSALRASSRSRRFSPLPPGSPRSSRPPSAAPVPRTFPSPGCRR